MRTYHHEVTHPGVSHVDVDVPDKFLNILIGPKGSNIKHIQNNWKVRVNIPNDLSTNRCVVIVGRAANCAAAKQYVLKMMDQSQEKAKETTNALSQPGWGNGLEEGEIDPRDGEEGPHEEWMDDFAPPPGGIKVDLANGWGAPAETTWT